MAVLHLESRSDAWALSISLPLYRGLARASCFAFFCSHYGDDGGFFWYRVAGGDGNWQGAPGESESSSLLNKRSELLTPCQHRNKGWRAMNCFFFSKLTMISWGLFSPALIQWNIFINRWFQGNAISAGRKFGGGQVDLNGKHDLDRLRWRSINLMS